MDNKGVPTPNKKTTQEVEHITPNDIREFFKRVNNVKKD